MTMRANDKAIRQRWEMIAAAIVGGIFSWMTGIAAAQDSPPDADGILFFEQHIRPVLVVECYECHSGNVAANQMGLSVELAIGLVNGGGSGPSIVKGKPEESLLIKAFKYEGALRMPPGGKLPDETIARFEDWIRMGAPDPRTGRGDPQFGTREIDWDYERRHWSFQPLQPREIPAVKNEAWPRADIDRFLLAKIEQHELVPTADAAPAVWLRRVTFDLTGLPPTPGELLDFELDASPQARQKVVERLYG